LGLLYMIDSNCLTSQEISGPGLKYSALGNIR